MMLAKLMLLIVDIRTSQTKQIVLYELATGPVWR